LVTANPIPGSWPGTLFITPRPRGGEWLQDEVRGWHHAGIDVIVSLLMPAEAGSLDLKDEQSACEAEGIQWLNIPVADRGVPASMEDFAEQLQLPLELLTNGNSVAVHCRQGVGRAPLAAIGILILSGKDVEFAIEQVGRARGWTVPETPSQRQWLMNFASVTRLKSRFERES